MGDTRPSCGDSNDENKLWKCITRTGGCSQTTTSCSEDGNVLEWSLDTGSKCSDSSKDCYKEPTEKENCESDGKGCLDGACIQECSRCSEEGLLKFYDGLPCGGTIPAEPPEDGEICTDDKRPAYHTCREGCQPLTNSCQYHSDCSSIKPSSFIEHEDGSVSLMVDTVEDRFCRITVGSSYTGLDSGDFDGNYFGVIGCKNLDDEDYHSFTLDERGDYATSTLTKKHQCKISNVAEDTEMRIACMSGKFKREIWSLRFRDPSDFKKIDLEITEDLNVDDKMKFKDITSSTSIEIDKKTDLPGLKVTIVKGNGAVGREEVPNRNLIWETDRKTLCHVKDSPGDSPRGNVANSGELWYSHEVYANEGIRYILCRDEYGNENIHPYIIDQTGPEVDQLRVGSDNRGGGVHIIELNWTESADASGIKQYHVRAKKGTLASHNWYNSDTIIMDCGDSLLPTEVGEKHTCKTTITLDPDTTYNFGVRAEDGVGNIGEVFTKTVETRLLSCEDACKEDGKSGGEGIKETNCKGLNEVLPGNFDDVDEGDICCCFK
jgi:hypothetical protein